MVKINVVLLKDPCSGCYIIEGLVRDTIKKLERQFSNLQITYTVLEELKNLNSIDGLEVEDFPAIIINGEQVTAGSIPDRKQLIEVIKMEEEINE